METSISAALEKAVRALDDADVDSPRWDAQLLLAWVLKTRREDLAREPERRLSPREQVIFEKAVALRAARRPLPYITGEAWFYGRPFKINRAVLIPRPETEGLARAALDAVRDRAAPRLADIGTGSGCLAVTLALEMPRSHVWATDLSPDALKTARKNIARYSLAEHITLSTGNLLTALPPGLRVDAVVSNLPYITLAELPGLQPEVRDYEPRLALSGDGDAAGPDGADLHRRLVAEARGVLIPGGWLLLEVGQGQSEAVADAARAAGYVSTAVLRDLSGIGRVVQACWPG